MLIGKEIPFIFLTKPIQSNEYTIESDWSAASYWFSVAALSDAAEIHLNGLRPDSWQGDHKITEIMRHFGVESTFTETGLQLSKKAQNLSSEIFQWDFTEVPDLAQTIAVVSAATGKVVQMTGLESLRIKETDRIFALQQELKKFNVGMQEISEGCFEVKGNWEPSKEIVSTYHDHRMAMAFAPACLTARWS